MKYAIDVKKKVLINGLMQKIHVIGTSQSNPILLFLHGGPGVCGRHNVIGRDCDLTDDFTLVAWDQRGTGGSYKGATAESMTLDNVIEDARQLVEYLCAEFGKKKIFIIGGSWGSELGTFLAYRHPEQIAAYVGFGQVVDGVKNEEISYQFTLDKAKAAGDKESLEILAKYGPPERGQYKCGLEGLMAQRKILEKYGGHSTKSKSMWKSTVKPILFSNEYSWEDKIGIIKGYRFCLVNLWPTICSRFILLYKG